MDTNSSDCKKEYLCHICGKDFDKKWKLDRHLNKKNSCIANEKYKCDRCGKIFDRVSNLKAHLSKKTKCQETLTEFKKLENMMQEMMKTQINLKIELKEELKQEIGKDHIIKFKEDIIPELNSNNDHLTNITTNSHNTQNNTNNTQNNITHGMNNSCLINYVIHQYPNAKNIEDCIKLENIPKATLVECEDLYFTDGAMKIFKGLCDLGEEHRPIHCTDASRCNYIYKTNDVWKIDVGGEAIRNHFFPVIQEAYTQVHKKRIKDNPGNSTIIGNYLTEMVGTNVKKICQKTLKKLSNDFLAKNSKNSKLIKMQKKS
jgi:DNA-directed RNA polymerase subunit RPC12/RpoP